MSCIIICLSTGDAQEDPAADSDFDFGDDINDQGNTLPTSGNQVDEWPEDGGHQWDYS